MALAKDWAKIFGQQLPPICGLIFGTLMIADQAYVSSRELSETLGVSQASISTMGRRLVETGIAERTVDLKTRRDLFSIRANGFLSMQRDAFKDLMIGVEIIDQMMALVSDDGPAARRLCETRDFFAYLVRELPLMVERYESSRPNNDR